MLSFPLGAHLKLKSMYLLKLPLIRVYLDSKNMSESKRNFLYCFRNYFNFQKYNNHFPFLFQHEI